MLGAPSALTVASFHTFMSHSPEAYLLGMKLDFQGILLLMWSSTIPLVYYSFPCRRTLGASYMVATSVLAALCSAVTFWQRFNAPHLGHYRAVLFGSFGLASFVAPIAHGVTLYGLELQSQRIGMRWIWATASCNGLGVVAYTLKVSSATSGRKPVMLTRCSSRRGGFLADLTCWERAIRLCTSWFFVPHCHSLCPQWQLSISTIRARCYARVRNGSNCGKREKNSID